MQKGGVHGLTCECIPAEGIDDPTDEKLSPETTFPQPQSDKLSDAPETALRQELEVEKRPACKTPGCRFRAHSDSKFLGLCCFACFEEGDHGPRCERVLIADNRPTVSGLEDSFGELAEKPVRADWQTMNRVWSGQLAALPDGQAEPVVMQPLDMPETALYQKLEPQRVQLEAYVRDQLRRYDESKRFPRPQDNLHGNRDFYEMHIRGKALKEIHRTMQRVDKCEKPTPPIVIIALMAVHITTESRLSKLRRTLKSIEHQELPASGVEFVVAVSWYASSPELSVAVQDVLEEFAAARSNLNVPDLLGQSLREQTGPGHSGDIQHGHGAVTVLTRQSERHTQFQHMRAALARVEAQLRQQWHIQSGLEGERSIWTIFGDDDDIWHPRRVAEYAHAIQTHKTLETVAIFATTARADVKIPWKAGEKAVTDIQMPCTADEIDTFLSSNLGQCLHKQEPCKEWSAALKAAGGDAALLPVREDMAMEYFNFCPRLRVLHEFFSSTSDTVIAHRFCDMRLCEFLVTYARWGHELGLTVSWFSPACWMYFYANAGTDMDKYEEMLEGPDEGDIAPGLIGAELGHVSTTIPLENSDIELAGKVCGELQVYDAALKPSRLARYIASFRNNIVLELVRRHTRTLDQRILDYFIFMFAMESFGKFADTLYKRNPNWNSIAAKKMFKICQGIAKAEMQALDVTVLWHKPDSFMMPDLDNSNQDELNVSYDHNSNRDYTNPLYLHRPGQDLNPQPGVSGQYAMGVPHGTTVAVPMQSSWVPRGLAGSGPTR